MDANSLKFDSNTFDLAICGYVIGHLGQHVENALEEIQRVLKPGGRAIIIDYVRDIGFLLLSTPHLFLLSYLRGKKARYLTWDFWHTMISSANLHISRLEKRKGFIILEPSKWLV